MSLSLSFLLGPVFFQTTLPRSGGLSPEEGWDAVGVNCKKGGTTENQGAGAWHMG